MTLINGVRKLDCALFYRTEKGARIELTLPKGVLTPEKRSACSKLARTLSAKPGFDVSKSEIVRDKETATRVVDALLEGIRAEVQKGMDRKKGAVELMIPPLGSNDFEQFRFRMIEIAIEAVGSEA